MNGIHSLGLTGSDGGVDFTTRLQKGGALLEDMRRLVLAWSDGIRSEEAVPFVMKVLGKPTLARAKDTYIRAFRPRFIGGDPPNAWMLARPLEDANASVEIIKPIYYWITARAERPLYDFVRSEIPHVWASASRATSVDEVMLWLQRRLKDQGKAWTPTIRRKVARGILAALRDFGLLEGRAKKTMVAYHLPLPSVALLARFLNSFRFEGRGLIHHPDWALFQLDEADVERRLLEAHQAGWLDYQAAGRIVRIEFPANTVREYVDVILG